MGITTIQISPKLRKRLQAAFETFLDRKIAGKYVGQWLQNLDNNSLPVPLRIQLATTLQNVLALEGGAEGEALLHAMDGLCHGGGAPIVLVKGLPADKKYSRITALISQAFAQSLHPDHDNFIAHDSLTDAKCQDVPAAYKPVGIRHLHHDDNDISLLAGVDAGANPRSTPVFDGETLVDYLVERSFYTTGETPEPCERETRRELFLTLLQMPIWPLPSEEGTKLAKALNVLHGNYAPVLMPNPHYCTAEPGSARYRFIQVPFNHLQTRFLNFDKRLAPPQWREQAQLLSDVFFRLSREPFKEFLGPVLGAGDLLIISNAQAIHAGGPYLHSELPEEASRRRPRKVVAVDLNNNPVPYPVDPGDRWRKTIIEKDIAEEKIQSSTPPF